MSALFLLQADNTKVTVIRQMCRITDIKLACRAAEEVGVWGCFWRARLLRGYFIRVIINLGTVFRQEERSAVKCPMILNKGLCKQG